VSELTNCIQALDRISQSLKTIDDQLHTSAPVRVSAPSLSSVPLDVGNDTIPPQTVSHTSPTPSSPPPQLSSIYLARDPALTDPPSPSNVARSRTHARYEPLQRPAIWKSRARRVVPRSRVFSEPEPSAWQTTSNLLDLREKEIGQAPGNTEILGIASRSRRPSILRSQSLDRPPLSSAQHETTSKPNISTNLCPTVCCVQLRVSPRKCLNIVQYQLSAPVAHKGVDTKSNPKKRSVAWASPVVSVRPLATLLVRRY
jgi:hypothetical protein